MMDLQEKWIELDGIVESIKGKNTEMKEKREVSNFLKMLGMKRVLPSVVQTRLGDRRVARIYVWKNSPIGNVGLLTGPSIDPSLHFLILEKDNFENDESDLEVVVSGKKFISVPIPYQIQPRTAPKARSRKRISHPTTKTQKKIKRTNSSVSPHHKPKKKNSTFSLNVSDFNVFSGSLKKIPTPSLTTLYKGNWIYQKPTGNNFPVDWDFSYFADDSILLLIMPSSTVIEVSLISKQKAVELDALDSHMYFAYLGNAQLLYWLDVFQIIFMTGFGCEFKEPSFVQSQGFASWSIEVPKLVCEGADMVETPSIPLVEEEEDDVWETVYEPYTMVYSGETNKLTKNSKKALIKYLNQAIANDPSIPSGKISIFDFGNIVALSEMSEYPNIMISVRHDIEYDNNIAYAVDGGDDGMSEEVVVESLEINEGKGQLKAQDIIVGFKMVAQELAKEITPVYNISPNTTLVSDYSTEEISPLVKKAYTEWLQVQVTLDNSIPDGIVKITQGYTDSLVVRLYLDTNPHYSEPYPDYEGRIIIVKRSPSLNENTVSVYDPNGSPSLDLWEETINSDTDQLKAKTVIEGFKLGAEKLLGENIVDTSSSHSYPQFLNTDDLDAQYGEAVSIRNEINTILDSNGYGKPLGNVEIIHSNVLAFALPSFKISYLIQPIMVGSDLQYRLSILPYDDGYQDLAMFDAFGTPPYLHAIEQATLGSSNYSIANVSQVLINYLDSVTESVPKTSPTTIGMWNLMSSFPDGTLFVAQNKPNAMGVEVISKIDDEIYGFNSNGEGILEDYDQATFEDAGGMFIKSIPYDTFRVEEAYLDQNVAQQLVTDAFVGMQNLTGV